jgi:hypothetical protein
MLDFDYRPSRRQKALIADRIETRRIERQLDWIESTWIPQSKTLIDRYRIHRHWIEQTFVT